MHWINAKQELPPSQMDVLVFCPDPYRTGQCRTARATFIDKYSFMITESDEIEYGEKCPHDEEYYLPEGWYESPVFGEQFSPIPDGAVTHWMKIPTMKKERK